MRLTLRELRAEVPAWTWTAERVGFGWRYIGTRQGRRVCVHAFSLLCGPAEDDFETSWRVDDDQGTSLSYVAWWMREADGEVTR